MNLKMNDLFINSKNKQSSDSPGLILDLRNL